MLGKYANVLMKYLSNGMLILMLFLGGNAFSTVIECKANLFGPEIQSYYCIGLDSKVTFLAVMTRSKKR